MDSSYENEEVYYACVGYMGRNWSPTNEECLEGATELL